MPDPKRRSRYTKAQIDAINERKKMSLKKADEKRGKWHWFLTVQIIGFILGIISLAFIAPNVLISWWEIILVVVIVGSVSALAQINYFKKNQIIVENLKLTNALYLSYNFIGIGFVTLFLLFILNRTVGTTIVKETHRIVGVDPEYQIYRWGNVVFLLENDAFASDVDLRALPYKFYYGYKERPYIEYEFVEGLFGYKIKQNHRLAKASN